MQEVYGDLWEYDADATVITTNGAVRRDGAAVMGRGCALQAAKRWPDLPFLLGDAITKEGNHVYSFQFDEAHLLTFPVKHHWKQRADLALIEQSANELVGAADAWWFREVVLPRPGCGNGRLDWTEVGPILESVLDDRFFVITYS